LGLKLKDLWKFLDTPASEIIKFAEVLICVDAGSVADLSDEETLSVDAIANASLL
jgi:hypothetical protein